MGLSGIAANDCILLPLKSKKEKGAKKLVEDFPGSVNRYR